MKERPDYIRARMKQGGIIGAVAGVALFGVGYMAYDSFVYALFIPIAAILGYYAPALLAGDEDY